jgi:hypothetical protein
MSTQFKNPNILKIKKNLLFPSSPPDHHRRPARAPVAGHALPPASPLRPSFSLSSSRNASSGGPPAKQQQPAARPSSSSCWRTRARQRAPCVHAQLRACASSPRCSSPAARPLPCLAATSSHRRPAPPLRRPWLRPHAARAMPACPASPSPRRFPAPGAQAQPHAPLPRSSASAYASWGPCSPPAAVPCNRSSAQLLPRCSPAWLGKAYSGGNCSPEQRRPRCGLVVHGRLWSNCQEDVAVEVEDSGQRRRGGRP